MSEKQAPVPWPTPMEHPPLYPDENPGDQYAAQRYRSGWNDCLDKCKAAVSLPQSPSRQTNEQVPAEFEKWYQSQPHHTVLSDPTVWQFAFDAFKAGQFSQSALSTEYATIAGLESSIGHLSQMVDELRTLLGTSMNAMKEVELNGSPIDESHGNIDCRVPYERWANFVDARAKLLHAVRQSAHHEILDTQLVQKTEEQS